MLLERARLIPACGNERIVLPLIEEAQVLVVLVVERENAEVLVEMWNISAVDDGAAFWLLLSSRMEGVYSLLWEFAGRREVYWMHRVVGKRFAGHCVGGGCPDRTRAKGRSSALPEGAPQQDQLICECFWVRAGLAFGDWVLACQMDKLQIFCQLLASHAHETQSEVFQLWP